MYINITSEYTPPLWQVLYVRNSTIPMGSGAPEKLLMRTSVNW